MQNVDYSKKFKSDSKKNANSETQRVIPPSGQQSKSYSIINFIGSQSSSWSFIAILIGSVLLFTSGLVVGMKIDQKESLFSSNEQNSFKNLGTNIQETETPEPITSATKPSTNVEEEKKSEPSQNNTAQNFNKSTVPTIPKGLKYPPLPNSVNYIIQVGNFSNTEANKWGKYLIKQREDFQGRLFRTSTGKLYLGYYYSYKDAKAALKQVQSMNGGMFEEASIKNIQF